MGRGTPASSRGECACVWGEETCGGPSSFRIAHESVLPSSGGCVSPCPHGPPRKGRQAVVALSEQHPGQLGLLVSGPWNAPGREDSRQQA